jgi:hypothetical protein
VPADVLSRVPGSELIGPAANRFDKADVHDRGAQDSEALVQVDARP